MIDKSIFESSNNTSFVLTDLHPLEVARQLTLAEFNLFKAITPTEIKSQAWNKKNWQEVSPNVYSIIQKFNRVGLWVATEIVTEHNPSKRKEVLRRCIEIADALRKLQNWNTLFAVISGLNQSSVSRLKRFVAGVHRDTPSILSLSLSLFFCVCVFVLPFSFSPNPYVIFFHFPKDLGWFRKETHTNFR